MGNIAAKFAQLIRCKKSKCCYIENNYYDDDPQHEGDEQEIINKEKIKNIKKHIEEARKKNAKV